MATTTDMRPGLAPDRPRIITVQAGASAKGRPLPAGAVKWSRVYLDKQNLPVESKHLVPVDENERRTLHLRYRCPHTERVKDGTKNMARVRCPMEFWTEPDAPAPYCQTHGKQAESDDKVQKASRQLVAWDQIGKSIKDPARPVWALAAEAVAGALARAEHMPAWWAVGAAAALAGGGYVAVRVKVTIDKRRHNKLSEGQKSGRAWNLIRRRARLAAYLGLAAGAWLGLASWVDPHSIAGVLTWFLALPVAWAIGSHPYRRYLEACRRPVPASELPEEPTDGDPEAPESQPDNMDPLATADATAWAEEVAPDAQGLKTTFVDTTTWQPDTGGRRMVIRAKRGAITDANLTAALPLIAGALDVTMSSIGWVPEHEGSPRAALLLVQPNSPLNEPVPGKPVGLMDIDDAVAHMGMKIDGSDLTTRLWTPGQGAPSRFIVGTKNAGKSGLIRRLLLAMLQARVLDQHGEPVRLIAPFLHDPKRGADYGAFRRLVSGFSIELDTLHMIIDAVIREMERRYDMLATTVWTDSKGRPREGERPFDPRIHGPVLSFVGDEFHDVVKDKSMVAKLGPLSRKMRAAGIEFTAASHMATYSDTGDGVVRDMMAGGEAWLLRTTSALNAALATGGQLVGDPRALPRIPGMLLQASGEGQTMQARAAYNDPDELYDMLHDDNNVPRIQPIVWPQETLDAFGPDFVGWMNASQNRPLGSPVPSVPEALKTGAAGIANRNLSAEETLQQILFEAGGPRKRGYIIEQPLWAGQGFGVTSTYDNAKNAGLKSDPPWLVALGGGVIDLVPEMRQQMAAAQREMENAA